MNVIEIQNISKSFLIHGKKQKDETPDVFWALQDVSFSIRQGAITAMIGPNGSGKTTLLRILARIIMPTSGTARMYGRVGSIIDIGSGFHPDLTGRENVYLNGVILGMDISGIKSRFDSIVAFAGVEAFIDTPVKFYSSGMYLRLAFSVAVHLDMDILLLDEVQAVGDEAFQNRCAIKLLELSREGRTLLTVSHDLDAVKERCSEAILLRQGVLIAQGSDVKGIINKYLNNEP